MAAHLAGLVFITPRGSVASELELTGDARLELAVNGVLTTPWIWELGEQLQETNYEQGRAQIEAAVPDPQPWQFRGGYSEDWKVLWITTHFLTAAALLDEMGARF
jgi:hypothetical protein